MRNSWLFKLLGAFLLIVAIGGLVISLLTSRSTQSAFMLYTTRSGQIWAQRLAPTMAGFYAQNNSWDGIETFIQTELNGNFWTNNSDNGMMGSGNGQGRFGGKSTGGEMMGVLGQRLILSNQQDYVIFDSKDEIVGQQLSIPEIKKGVAILVDQTQVGTLLITPDEAPGINTPTTEFIASVQRAIVSSAVIAGIVALILGALLFIQITAPMRKLRKATLAISEGNLNQRVDIKGKDEFGDLGNTFNKMAESLSQAEIQRQHLMADVAHELRTPLTAIQGTLEGMQDGVLPCDREQLDALYAETLLLNRLIGDLRLLSLAESSQLKLELQETDPCILIQQIVDRMQTQATAKNIRLQTEFRTKKTTLQLDPDRITQVISNLLTNALRYTNEGGTILVETTQVSPSTPFIISVSDTGQGIDPENLPHIFDRFFRAEKSRSRASGGSGLGLAIVKELVEAHGGKVSVKSPIYDDKEPGYGTRFIIELPARE